MAFAGFRLTDWEIDRDVTPALISYTGDDHVGVDPSYASVIEFHRGISALADDATSVGDDEHDITDADATDRSTDNIITLLAGYDLNAAAKEHLYDGSIIFNEDGKIWDGVVNFGNATTIQVIQNGAVITDDWWNNDPFSNGFGGLNSDQNAGISHRFLVEVRNNTPADIDGRRLLGTSRTFGNTYAEFPINGTARGNNVLALSEANDIFNNNTAGDVSGWVITNTEGFQELDIDGTGASGQAFYSQWDDTVGTGTNRAGTINDVYEYIKWATRDGTSETLYGLNGELFRGITHSITLDSAPSPGNFTTGTQVNWDGGDSTGQVLAFDTNNNILHIQLLTGVAPTGVDTISDGTNSAGSNVTTDRPISLPFLGSSTGTNLIGAFGIGTNPASVGSSDQLFDLTSPVSVQRIPPNNVTFQLTNLDFTVSNEDRILVTNNNGGDIDFSQLALSGTLNTNGVASIVVSTAIPLDTPSSGTIRVQDDAGRYRRIAYSSYSGSTFTVDGAASGTEDDFGTVNATSGNNVFISYIDRAASAATESFSGVNLNRTLFIRVRNGGNTPIKPFTSTATVNNADASVSVGRISDA